MPRHLHVEELGRDLGLFSVWGDSQANSFLLVPNHWAINHLWGQDWGGETSSSLCPRALVDEKATAFTKLVQNWRAAVRGVVCFSSARSYLSKQMLIDERYGLRQKFHAIWGEQCCTGLFCERLALWFFHMPGEAPGREHLWWAQHSTAMPSLWELGQEGMNMQNWILGAGAGVVGTSRGHQGNTLSASSW